ncbi:MAG: hypothetical protein QUS33_05980 [Dehalococcoidia bacterium]|nr:hypothetical protein [Dehalococcoidia bacterium]
MVVLVSEVKRSYNPYLPEQAPVEYMKTKFMYDEYVLNTLVPYINSTRWSQRTKNKYIAIVMEMFYPDMKLANLSEAEARRWVASLNKRLLMARVGCDRDETSTTEYAVMNDVIKEHATFPISRAIGPDRAAMLLIRTESHARYYEEQVQRQREEAAGPLGRFKNAVQRVFR